MKSWPLKGESKTPFGKLNTSTRIGSTKYSTTGGSPTNIQLINGKLYQIDPSTFEAIKTKVNIELMREAIAYYQTAAVDFKLGLLKESLLK